MKTLSTGQRARRERILSTTRDQLSRYGYDGINMRDLAAAAEVATTTLYNLYNSKDDLILESLKDIMEDLQVQMHYDEYDALELFVESKELVAKQIAAIPNYSRAMATMLFNADPSSKVVSSLIGEVIERQTVVLEGLVKEGIISRDINLHAAARQDIATHWSTILMWMKGYVALHAFPRTSVRDQLTLLLSWTADEPARKRVLAKLKAV